MTPESRNSPLLDNGSLNFFSAIRNRLVEVNALLRNHHIFLWRYDFIETDLVRKAFSMSSEKQQTFSTVTARLYKEPSREE